MNNKLTAFALLVLLAAVGFTGCARKKCECLTPAPVQATSLQAQPLDDQAPSVSPSLARKRYTK